MPHSEVLEYVVEIDREALTFEGLDEAHLEQTAIEVTAHQVGSDKTRYFRLAELASELDLEDEPSALLLKLLNHGENWQLGAFNQTIVTYSQEDLANLIALSSGVSESQLRPDPASSVYYASWFAVAQPLFALTPAVPNLRESITDDDLKAYLDSENDPLLYAMVDDTGNRAVFTEEVPELFQTPIGEAFEYGQQIREVAPQFNSEVISDIQWICIEGMYRSLRAGSIDAIKARLDALAKVA